jgi:hypothetical protein
MTDYNMTNSHITKEMLSMDFNYFSYLCFAWATLGIITRILMVGFGDKWNRWEMNHAYSKKKPKWIYGVAIIGVLLVLLTWYKVFSLNVKGSWIIATILSLTLVKISALLFNYEKFRTFASNTLNNPKKKMRLTISVLLMSIVFILLGLFVY